ncbi:MAG: F0F1 ATP synthase subunit B [Sphingobium sp.]|jgi:F-type H+-transporting ATPase subunit b|nr:F0F1 ATP synthase subunit B [Sphingobium sp.]MCP5398509.1 F0F1 ATP synthase subunit B [Sphingomonas sp.]
MVDNVSEGSAAVAQNLENADKVQDIHGEVHAATEAHGGPAEHGLDPAIGGAGGFFNATAIVSVSMAVFIAVLIWKKVPALIGKALDDRIAGIRSQLDEAAKLRAEAEALKSEYQAKLAGAEKDAEALRARAEEEAGLLVAEAKANATALVKRRQKMAEDKIAAAERTAIADIRAKAVSAATGAAAALIAENHDAAADKTMVDSTIKGLGTIN